MKEKNKTCKNTQGVNFWNSLAESKILGSPWGNMLEILEHMANEVNLQ